MTNPEERLQSMGIALPDVLPPVAQGYAPAFAPFIRTGSHIYISGRLAKKGQEILSGKMAQTSLLSRAKRRRARSRSNFLPF